MKKSLAYIFPNPPEELAVHTLDEERIPRHVALIMDGNGRWAKAKLMRRLEGHKAGIRAVREAIRTASDLGIDYLTIYSFSSENWKRPQEEVLGLMDLFAKTMLAELDELHKEGVRVATIGRLGLLPEKTRHAFEEAWERTKHNKGLTLLVAVNYGGRQEIQDAANSACAQKLEASKRAFEDLANRFVLGTDEVCTPDNLKSLVNGVRDIFEQMRNSAQTFEFVSAQDIEDNLYFPHIPDPDLVIRTSGEMRISNFLLWQIAYSEIYATPCLWPDFDRYVFLEALLDYQARSRRFGALES